VAGPFDKLGGHLQNAVKQYEEASRSLDRFSNRLETIAEKAAEKDEEGGEPSRSLVLLPPS
jgi:DNA anti-recombination protein RmuC